MNTDKQLPVIEKNFHCMNDDRFIYEKISMPVEQQEGEDIHAAINRTRQIIIDNFKAAYPRVDTRLNFDEVVQVKQNDEFEVIRYPPINEVLKEHPNLQAANNATSQEYGNTLEEQIRSCKTLAVLKIYEKKPKTDDEQKAYDKKYLELSMQKKSTQL